MKQKQNAWDHAHNIFMIDSRKNKEWIKYIRREAKKLGLFFCAHDNYLFKHRKTRKILTSYLSLKILIIIDEKFNN